MSRRASSRLDHAAAVAHLRVVDPALGTAIDASEGAPIDVRPSPSVFEGLAEAIVYQQLSTRAAATIYGRLRTGLGGADTDLQPDAVLAARDEELRSAGLSRAKTAALRDLAERTVRGELPTLAELRKLTDAEIVDRLTRVRGIGRWTAQMFLIFRLGRPDVLPADDLGLRRGYAAVFGGALPSPQRVEEHGERWSPYRTTATGYLWRAASGGGL